MLKHKLLFHISNQNFEALLNAYDADLMRLDGDWGNQKDPNEFFDSLVKFEKKFCESQFFHNKNISYSFKKISKKELLKYCQKDISLLEKVIAILAWGGMRQDHFIRLMTGTKFKSLSKVNNNQEDVRFSKKNWHSIEDILHSLKNSDDPRKFHYLSMKNLNLNYCGPAYYTKILYFLFRKKDCFIMDQWTSKSMNILLQKKIITLSGNYVSKTNDENIYDKFCKFILFMQEKISATGRNISPDETEDLLFSRGGGKALYWRNFIKINYS